MYIVRRYSVHLTGVETDRIYMYEFIYQNITNPPPPVFVGSHMRVYRNKRYPHL